MFVGPCAKHSTHTCTSKASSHTEQDPLFLAHFNYGLERGLRDVLLDFLGSIHWETSTQRIIYISIKDMAMRCVINMHRYTRHAAHVLTKLLATASILELGPIMRYVNLDV